MAAPMEFALDTVVGLSAAIENANAVQGVGANQGIPLRSFVAGCMYCGSCGGHRRVYIESDAKFDLVNIVYKHFGARFKVSVFSTPAPALFRYLCTQCDGAWSVLIYPSDTSLSIAVLPAQANGSSISTPNAPEGVAYYLNQAALCHYIGANSAAVTMFRSAAEWILEDQGFKSKMLGPKLSELEAAIGGGTAPKWASEIDPEYLKAIKNLGNMAAHTNSGDLGKQDALDAQLYREVEVTFSELLDLIYEQPIRRANRLAELKKAAV